MLYPEVAFRSCEDCQKHVYDHETGRREEWPAGSGNPVARLPGSLPPCADGPTACAKVSPGAGVELNERNSQCYRHYLECRATSSFPDDALVRHHAAVIRSIEDSAERMERKNLNLMLQCVLGVPNG